MIVAAFVLLLGIAGCAAAYQFLTPKPVAISTPKAPPKPFATAASSKVLFTGNSYFSRYINDEEQVYRIRRRRKRAAAPPA